MAPCFSPNFVASKKADSSLVARMAAIKIDHSNKAMDMNNQEMIRDRGMVFMHLSYHLSELMNN